MSTKRNNVRAPVDKSTTNTNKGVRRVIGAQIKMDMSAYEDQYPDKKLMIINDIDGDVQRWLDAGAEPVPSKIEGRKTYEGLNDKGASQWVRFSTSNGDRQFYAYGLMMDKDLYFDYKHAPQIQRHRDTTAAMKQGKSGASESLSLPDGAAEVGSYAPNLPDGSGQGYNEIMSKQWQPYIVKKYRPPRKLGRLADYLKSENEAD